jgi:hypothetical protein
MQAEAFVRETRGAQFELLPSQMLQLVTHREDEAEGGEDRQAAFREEILEELQKNLCAEDGPLLRFLLEQEIAYHENLWCICESIRFCGFLLCTLAHVEDVGLLWKAKTVSFDTMCGFDVQFLVGTGVALTSRYLRSLRDEWAQDALTHIEERQSLGDFDDLEQYYEEKQKFFRGETLDTIPYDGVL